MVGRFRHTPPEPDPAWLERPRVARRLARRFEVPVLVVAAPAGYGKTSSLAQAIHVGTDRSAAGQGSAGGAATVDVWLQCESTDADAVPFAHGILEATGVARRPTEASDLAGAVADALARYAPTQVCLVLDDVHRVPDDSAGMRLLDDVVAALPRNAHVLLSGRRVPAVRLARHDLHGMVEHLGVADLEFDDAELVTAVGDRSGDATEIDEAARWPALASLTRRTTLTGPMEFLLEEVTGGLEPDRLVALRALAHLADITDDVARAASAGRWGAAEILDGLPLVQRGADGDFQIHDLWRQSLAPGDAAEPLPADVAEALVRIADVRLEHRATIDAARLYGAAARPDRVTAAVAAFASDPPMMSSSSDLRRMLEIARAAIPGHLLTRLLEASVSVTGNEREAAAGMERLARSAADEGDDRVEAIALYHALNMHSVLDPDVIPGWIGERAGEIVARGTRAALVASVMVRAHHCRAAGEPEQSAAVLAELIPPATTVEIVSYSFGMSDIGRPEQVSTPDDMVAAVAAGGHYVASAMWLTGTAPPDVALALGASLGSSTEAGGIAHVQVSTNAVLAIIALAAGEHSTARRYADAALRRSAETGSVHIRAFAHLADALCVMCESGDDAARPRFERLLEEHPIAHWPSRPYLYALPSVYLLAPVARPVLDRCRFGPALSAALAAANALVALTEHGDPRPAFDLAWDRPLVLRAHVMPQHLALLAAAAAAAGHGGIDGLLADLPAAREHLVRATKLSHAPTVDWARARVATMPARPDFDVRVEVLGPMRLVRGDTLVTDQAWAKRERVRQLLAYLVLHRRIARRRVAEALWPNLATTAALDNLRVNLTHLQKVLQPHRGRDEPPWFVRADGDVLELVATGLAVDAVEFEDACRAARDLDDRGRSTDAIVQYERATSLYRGDYLDDWADEEWIAVERFRLQVLAIGARCRLGELLLARGEPEQAAAHAADALRAEPLHERAARLLAHASIAQSHRAGAKRALDSVVRRLREQGLHPEPETERLARTLGIDVAV